jgi:radical SAM superfamily enzyme YgiQ (UPF0313 family)
MTIFLVRPHPPAAILAQSCPIPEDYKYNWQPTALKYIAYRLRSTFGDKLDIKLWHLMDKEDDEKLKAALKTQKPELVAFSEIDILVGEVNSWAVYTKKLLPDAWTVVGGKHTSLLREGDRSPFTALDFALRGDSVPSLIKIIAARLEGTRPEDCRAALRLDEAGRVLAPVTYDQRTDISALDGVALQSCPVENHSFEEYLEKHQVHPALIPGPVRTASLLAGSGCPHRCVFCQSPVEYGEESNVVMTRDPEKLAGELAWLVKEHGVNNVFSLEANLCFKNWLRTYECLEKRGIERLAVSGVVRASDVADAYREGLLQKLAAKGMRVLSVGLDIPFGSDDVYRKAFSHQTMLECLSACRELGILLTATFVGDPMYTAEEFRKQLRYLKDLPVAAVDIRLAIALRNTDFYRRMSSCLIYHPEAGRRYFDRQNYRYQTIRVPGKITPRQTYQAVRAFRKEFLTSDAHFDYVLDFARRFPESVPFFRKQYAPVAAGLTPLSGKLKALAGVLGIQEVPL